MNNEMNDYVLNHDLKQIIFEESYVLEIINSNKTITFVLEAAISDDSQHYSKPINNQLFCYKKIQLIFDKITSVVWINEFSNKKIRGIDDEEDFGTIESFKFNNNKYI